MPPTRNSQEFPAGLQPSPPSRTEAPREAGLELSELPLAKAMPPRVPEHRWRSAAPPAAALRTGQTSQVPRTPRQCPGWTPEEAAVTAMIDELCAVLRPYQYEGLPPGAALACHPALYYAMLTVVIPSFTEFAAMSGGAAMLPFPSLPVIIDPELAHGSWQLVLARGGLSGLVVVRHPIAGGRT
jgi:hypothetical protein